MNFTRILIVLAALLALAGAAGIRTQRPAVAQAPGCSVSPGELNVDAEEQSALELINALRAENRAPALTLSPSLGQAAAHKSSAMAASGSFGHDDPGRSFSQRVRDCGYRLTPNIAENIAVGVDTGAAVVQMWRNSPAHHRIMLDPSMRALGVARVRGAAGWYWTANFGGMVEGGEPAAAPATTAAAAQPTAAASTPPAGGLQPGAAATVATDDGDCLNVRGGPGRNAPILTCLPDGTAVRIAAGPITADGVAWWQLDGLGWAAGEFLAPAGQR